MQRVSKGGEGKPFSRIRRIVLGSYCSICRGNQDVSKMEEIAREFGINRYSTVSTIIDRTRNEVVKKRRIRRRIEQLRHELEMSQKQTDPIIS